jgi:enoyl-CoA hydratase/carnithine racemase
MPFDVSLDDGILTLTLDTPKSPINIFNHATAHQLVEILSSVTPQTTRAVVFATAKPNSFINGVGLLLAQASQTYEDIVRASTPPWEAYRAVHAAPVPTIAVVHGNCFGCGVEFALHCDYRIATDSCETHFYMTELHDYLFIPLFGGTWNLPEAVGLADSIDLLLWGERWSATTAYERGLVDEVVPHAERAERTQTFLRRVLGGEQTSRRRGRVRWGGEEDATVARTRRRITALPPAYHAVYTAGLELLIDGARQTRTYAEHQREELRHSAASALSPIGKSAFGFFYLRQMAGERAAGRFANGATPATLRLDVGDDADARAFAKDLHGRRLPGVRDAWGLSPEGSVPLFVRASFADGPPADAVLYAPTYRAGGRLVELAIRDAGMDADEAARLAGTLQRLGFEVARTTPICGFVSNRLLMAYFTPLVRFVANGGTAKMVNGALRAAGFVRRPHQLLAALDRPAFTAVLAKTMGIETAALESLLATLESDAYDDGVSDSTVIDAVCISMLDAILALRARQEVRDLSIADLIARELLDFPRHFCSLCSWLKRHRVAQAVSGGSPVRSIVSERAFETARTFAVEGRELYR